MNPRCLALAALLLPGAALAQFPTGLPRPFPDTGQRVLPRGDTTRADTTHAPPRELVKWAEPDSVMTALMARQGYVVTRYQGKVAALDARRHILDLSGTAAVQREQTILVADTIVYDDSTKLVRAGAPPGDTIILRDPSQGTSDLVAFGGMEYDIGSRRGVVRDLTTSSAEAGITWYVHGQRAAVVGDTSAHGASTSYAEDGSITSCDHPVPDYHFEAKEIKMISRHLLVARPAVLYIEDVPVMWLPFIVQDMRRFRRSGIIPPRFGLSDIVRTSPTYSRQIDNLGYYFALSDYMDATVSLDWRSGNGAQTNGAGWTRWNGEWRYRWLDRFLSGAVRASYSTFSTGATSLNVSWSHQQQFSLHSSLNANLNYSSNTTAIQQQAFTVAQTFAAIASALNFQQGLGPANVSIGGTRTQYTGRQQVDQNFPNLSVTTKPVAVGSWLLWSPQLSINNTQNLHMDAAPIPYVYTPAPGGAGYDSVKVDASQRTTTMSFQTPLRILGFTWQNSFQVNDHEESFPRVYDVYDFTTGRKIGERTYARTYLTSIDWQTGITLPALMQRSLKLSPFVQIVNADPSSGFWIRSQLSGGQWVQQKKTLQYGISMSPSLFGFFPGFGPFSRIRHTISPRITYGYSPAAAVSDEFLKAQNRTRANYLGGLARNTISFQLDQVFEAKLKAPSDSNPDAAQKIKLLAIGFSPITYDFERAAKTGTGITTNSFSYRLSSDLLPGFDFGVTYSLYQGDIMSDTAKFKPYRTGISASFSIGSNNNPLTVIRRIFGKAEPKDTTGGAAAQQQGQGQSVLDQTAPIAGPTGSRYGAPINTGGGWTASFNFSSTRSRPIPGATVIDPRTFCKLYITDPVRYQACINSQAVPSDTLGSAIAGGHVYVAPPLTTLRSNVSFQLTPKWAMQWTTGYDFVRREFSDQNVTLQRDMHDWRMNIGFSRAPTGSFFFSFFISLKAEPDLKFNYNRTTVRCNGSSCANVIP